MNVPIIGIGSISAAGLNSSDGFSSLRNGEDGLRPLTLFESGLKEKPLCGEVNVNLSKYPNRAIALAVEAMKEALSSENLISVGDIGNYQTALFSAMTVAGMTETELFYKEYLDNRKETIPTSSKRLRYHEPAAVSGYIAKKFGIKKHNSISTACSTGLHSIGLAKKTIESGKADIAIALGVDPLSYLTVRGFASLMLIDFNGCKPFDKMRIGISLGEGAGVIVLASKKLVEDNNLTPMAYVAGWGASADAYHMTAPHPEGAGAISSIRKAFADAQITAEQIDLIVAHGTATPDNDKAEISAMKKIFSTLPPFTSLKRNLGHTLAASGTIETVFAVKMLQNGFIPKTVGFETKDPEIGVKPSSGENKEINYILKNAFGFGGNNASLIISSEAK